MRKNNKVIAAKSFALLSLLTITQQASFAGFGNLFSGANDGTDSLPNGASSVLTPPGAIGTVDGDDGTARHGAKSKSGSNGSAGATAPPGDYTVDEIRMQGRYNSDCNNARANIARGEKMMKSGNAKIQKKGAILKQIGEKDLARLKENNPFPAQHSLEEKHGAKPDSL
jgi:hypothetical protein